ncbi:MAG: hypothetical protein QOD65_3806 [Gaiellales bacterium]|jgi:hypothetical protein|nr:hypothetical protein [Gaiellales bacterium]MDX6600197.1 hypothetical protein [Gaiellales bacterium]
MDPNAAATQAALEDRIFVLEMALTSIGTALLAPKGWGDDNELHQEMYATVRRVLRGNASMLILERREAQLEARESTNARTATDAVMSNLHSQVSASGEQVARP